MLVYNKLLFVLCWDSYGKFWSLLSLHPSLLLQPTPLLWSPDPCMQSFIYPLGRPVDISDLTLYKITLQLHIYCINNLPQLSTSSMEYSKLGVFFISQQCSWSLANVNIDLSLKRHFVGFPLGASTVWSCDVEHGWPLKDTGFGFLGNHKALSGKPLD